MSKLNVKKITLYSLCFLVSFLMSNKVYQQTVNLKKNAEGLVGVYRSKGGLLFILNRDSSFFILKNWNKKIDAPLIGCDTIAKGRWALMSNSVIKLADSVETQQIKFDVKGQNMLSPDSLYFKIDLPKDDAFYDGRFLYQVSMFPSVSFLESKKPMIVIPKKKIYRENATFYDLRLDIQDLTPINCNFEGKCFQRIYFNIFQDYKISPKFNYFNINVLDFDNCFVERAPVNNEFVFIASNSLHWRDMDFIKK